MSKLNFRKKVKKILYLNVNLYYLISFYYLLNKLRLALFNNKIMSKLSEDSKKVYENYDDREQENYKKKSRVCLFNNKLVNLGYKNITDEYLKYIYEEIDKLLVMNKQIKIIEVGCGNCINIVNILKKYPMVSISGIDISPKRITVAKNYFRKELKDIHFDICDLTKGIPNIASNSIDLVFSMHCLEQISHDCKPAILEMFRITKNKLVMIEPVIELGRPAQKLYLILQDHNRILLKTIKKLNMNITEIKVLNIQSNPLNQSSKIVIEK